MKINSLRALEKFDLKKVLRNQADARTLYKEQIVLLSDEIAFKAGQYGHKNKKEREEEDACQAALVRQKKQKLMRERKYIKKLKQEKTELLRREYNQVGLTTDIRSISEFDSVISTFAFSTFKETKKLLKYHRSLNMNIKRSVRIPIRTLYWPTSLEITALQNLALPCFLDIICGFKFDSYLLGSF